MSGLKNPTKRQISILSHQPTRIRFISLNIRISRFLKVGREVRLDGCANGFASGPVALEIAVAVEEGDFYAPVEEGAKFAQAGAEDEVT